MDTDGKDARTDPWGTSVYEGGQQTSSGREDGEEASRKVGGNQADRRAAFPITSPSGTLCFGSLMTYFFCLGKALPTPPLCYPFFLTNSHKFCRSGHKCQFFYEPSSNPDRFQSPTHPALKFNTPFRHSLHRTGYWSCNCLCTSLLVAGNSLRVRTLSFHLPNPRPC